MPHMAQLDSRWTRHLEADSVEKFRQSLYNDTLVLNRLYSILEDMEAEIERADLSEKAFDNPNWQYQTAFRFGQKSQLIKVKQLLNFIKE